MEPAGTVPPCNNRREFLGNAVAAACASACAIPSAAGDRHDGLARVPWYRRSYRWGQTNLTEADPARFNLSFWRRYWKETEVQGVIINAGGIYAYYPSRFPLHHCAATLGDRDLYGEIARAAHDDGLAVLARMDSSRAHKELYEAHPDWFASDHEGKPFRNGEHFITCVNSPYFKEYLPDILREIIERSHPEGFTDNSWSGLDRAHICHCEHCGKSFLNRTGKPLPRAHDWNDANYQAWIEWSYECRLAVWNRFNRVTREAGGPDCLWIGMNSGSISGQSRSFRDVAAICARAPILMLDHQSRGESDSFQNNIETGKLLHGVLGWDKLIPESMPMYQMGRPTYRLSSKPEPEARMWMLAGFAGGIQPWWHHVGAYHEDRRAYNTAPRVMRWHKDHQTYLVDRVPVANVGLVWSQQNTDFFGRDDPETRVDQPFRGWTRALVRARIPHVPVHVDQIDRQSPALAVLILPNIGAISDAQLAAVRRYVEWGGSLIATGQTSLYGPRGDPRPDFGLGVMFGVRGARPELIDSSQRALRESQHSYLRIEAEPRHPVMAGFDETSILPFGGTLASLTVDARCRVPLTFIPPLPVFPPETAWMRQPRTTVPGLIINESGSKRVVFLPADIDRRYAIDHLPDHGNLLANLVRWGAHGSLPLEVRGRGLVDCELYLQPGRLILHLVNLTSAEAWRPPVDELIPVGPFQIRVRIPEGVQPKAMKRLVSGATRPIASRAGWVEFEVDSVHDHEVVVLEP
jgi:hypothetical protein